MAVMTVGPGGIEIISGALTRPKKTAGHNHGRYFVATHRVKETSNPNCQRVYSFGPDRYKSSKPLTADARDARARFAEVAAAVRLRKGNLTTLSQDQANFLAQQNTAGGCVTFKQYLWKVCGDAYDAQH